MSYSRQVMKHANRYKLTVKNFYCKQGMMPPKIARLIL
jgi:hypothetical protein